MTTRQIAADLGVIAATVCQMIMRGKIPEPGRNRLGHYEWTEADLQRARQALAADRRRKEYKHLRGTFVA